MSRPSFVRFVRAGIPRAKDPFGWAERVHPLDEVAVHMSSGLVDSLRHLISRQVKR